MGDRFIFLRGRSLLLSLVRLVHTHVFAPMLSVFALCGSTRLDSSNMHLLRSIQRSWADAARVEIFEDLLLIPPFQPEDGLPTPSPVATLREAFRRADIALFCTPEYAGGVPGILKNALDWCVGSGELYAKKCAVITASSRGEDAHHSLMITLRMMGVDLSDERRLLISGIRAKLDSAGRVVDTETQRRLDAIREACIRTFVD